MLWTLNLETVMSNQRHPGCLPKGHSDECQNRIIFFGQEQPTLVLTFVRMTKPQGDIRDVES